jgi:hypothetical protein
MLQRGQADHVVWVYAITDGLSPDQLAGLSGVGGEHVRAVAESGLTAVVGSVDAAEFGEEGRTSLLSDLASIERLGRAHHQVIACVAADGPVLPLRLATVYPDDQTVRTLLARSSAEFAVMLESFRGTEEWGVKVYAGTAGDGHANGSGVASATPAAPAAGQEPDARGGWQEAPPREWSAQGKGSGTPADVPTPAADALGTGRKSGRRTEPQEGQKRAEPSWDDAEAYAEMIDRALSGIAVATRRHPGADPRLEGPEKYLVLNAAYLLNVERAGEFTAVTRALARVHDGVRADLTGPWPPYSFADLHQA